MYQYGRARPDCAVKVWNGKHKEQIIGTDTECTRRVEHPANWKSCMLRPNRTDLHGDKAIRASILVTVDVYWK